MLENLKNALRGRRSLRDSHMLCMPPEGITSHEVTAPRVTGPSGRTFFQGLIVCLLAVVMLGASGDSNRFGRIGHNLVCVCSCGQILLECNHVGCPDSSRMIGELTDQLAGPNGQGADSLITNWFVAKYGGTVLAAPIRGGFDVVAWIIPLALFVLALFGTAFVVKTWAARRHAAVGPGGLTLDMPVDHATRERIRRETEW